MTEREINLDIFTMKRVKDSFNLMYPIKNLFVARSKLDAMWLYRKLARFNTICHIWLAPN